MPRTKKEIEQQNNIIEQSVNLVEKKVSTRGRKKKVVEPASIVSVNTSNVLTLEEQNKIDFDSLQPLGLMRYKASDYEDVKTGYELCTRHLKHLIHSTENNVLKIGVLLNEVETFHKKHFDNINGSHELNSYELNKVNAGKRDTNVFLERKYFKDIYDYAAYNLSLSRGTVSNYMNLARRFTSRAINITTGNVDLLDTYSDYTPSQLIQLLPYSDDDIQNAINNKVILPGMSCRFIAKTMRTEYKLSNSDNELSDSNKQITDKHLDNDVNAVINDMNDFEVSQNEHEKTSSSAALDASNIKITSLDTLPDYSYFEQIFNSYIKNGYEIELIAVKK